MTNLWLKVVGNLLCKKLHGSNSINFERERERRNRQQKYTLNDLFLIARIAIKIRITTARAVRKGMNIFHFVYWIQKKITAKNVNR